MVYNQGLDRIRLNLRSVGAVNSGLFEGQREQKA
jgi:hypothetical protein